MKPNGGGAPSGPIKDLIEKSFGSFEAFKDTFTTTALNHFGSGWVWLVEKDGEAKIWEGHDAMNPLKDGAGTPLLTVDVWEHAYYVDKQNRRPDYMASWWELINWDFANEVRVCAMGLVGVVWCGGWNSPSNV
jgi:Fe-Mn family superoxide dismutase